MRSQITIIFFILMLKSILTFSQINNNNFGTIIFSLKFSSFNETGLGGEIKIINVATEQEFSGKSTNRFNSHIIIQNLPQGVYKIFELTIKTGSGQIRYYDASKFNQININEGKVFYLGAYKTKKTSEWLKLNYILSSDKNIDTLKIKEQLLRINQTENYINFTQKLFKSDTTYLNRMLLK